MRASPIYRELHMPLPSPSPSPPHRLSPKRIVPRRSLSYKLRRALCCSQERRSRISRLKRLFICLYVAFCLFFIGATSLIINRVVTSWLDSTIKSKFQSVQDRHNLTTASIYRDVTFMDVTQVTHALTQSAVFFQHVRHLAAA